MIDERMMPRLSNWMIDEQNLDLLSNFTGQVPPRPRASRGISRIAHHPREARGGERVPGTRVSARFHRVPEAHVPGTRVSALERALPGSALPEPEPARASIAFQKRERERAMSRISLPGVRAGSGGPGVRAGSGGPGLGRPPCWRRRKTPPSVAPVSHDATHKVGKAGPITRAAMRAHGHCEFSRLAARKAKSEPRSRTLKTGVRTPETGSSERP